MSVGSLAGGISGLLLGSPSGLQEWLARRFEVDAALLVDSGTSALRLAIQGTSRSGAAARIALPAYACYDLATAAIGAGGQVAFYDVDPLTLGPDWASFASVLSAGVDAVVLVHQYGIPVDLDRARLLADAHGALVIEDAAQGAGGWWRHRRLGAHGDLGILSFGRGKGMTAGGGGALLANSTRGREVLDRARKDLRPAQGGLGNLLKLAAQAALSAPPVYGVPARMPWLRLGDTPFHEPWDPRALAATSAGVLQQSAELADEEAERRRAGAARLEQELGSVGRTVRPPDGDGSRPGWLRYPVLLEADLRSRALSPAGRRLGIASGYPVALSVLPQLTGAGGTQLAGATQIVSRLVTLPSHRLVQDGDRAAITSLLRS